VFFSLAIEGDRWFNLGLLWFLVNGLLLVFLLRAVFVGSSSNRLICWYLYVLSVCTDFISLVAFGHVSTFRTIMGVCVLIAKPVFAVFEWRRLRADGINVKGGLQVKKVENGQTYVRVNDKDKYTNTQQSETLPPGQVSYGQPTSGGSTIRSPRETKSPQETTSPKEIKSPKDTKKEDKTLDEFFAEEETEDDQNIEHPQQKNDSMYPNLNKNSMDDFFVAGDQPE